MGMPHDNEFLGEADPVVLHADFWYHPYHHNALACRFSRDGTIDLTRVFIYLPVPVYLYMFPSLRARFAWMDTDTLNLLAGRSRVNFLWKRLMGSTVLDATIHTSVGHDDETDDATASTQ